MTRPLRVGALFAGYGGIELALADLLDTELVWYAEVDPGACLILAHRFPGVPNLGDVTKVDWATVPPVDILTGGSPCQDLSNAGGRLGMTEGTRSNLWVAMRHAIAALRPDLVIWENVRGAYSAEATSDLERDPRLLADVRRTPGEPVLRALGRVLGDLAALGFDAEWRGLPACAVGAPHERFRVFLAAYPQERGFTIRPRRRGLPVLTPPSLLLPTPRVGGQGDNPSERRWKSPNLETTLNLLPTPRASDGEKGGPNQRGSSGDLMLPSAVHRLLPTPLVGSTSPASHGQISGQYRRQMDEAFSQWGDYVAAITLWENLTRPAPDPRRPNRHGNLRLSPYFSEWMMGLPNGWVVDVPGLTGNQALKALGNGVVRQQAAAAVYDMLTAAAR